MFFYETTLRTAETTLRKNTFVSALSNTKRAPKIELGRKRGEKSGFYKQNKKILIAKSKVTTFFNKRLL